MIESARRRDRAQRRSTTARRSRGADYELDHGSVVIAAITSCTNTSNPQVMVAAGLLARNARRARAAAQAVGEVVARARLEGRHATTTSRPGLQEHLDELGFNTVGYGCTTCIGNSGPLADEISAAIAEGDLVVCSVLSGNRNFEARIHPEVKANYLASPPLVVAYALAGAWTSTSRRSPTSTATTSTCATSGRARSEIGDTIASVGARASMFAATYADVFTGDDAVARAAGSGGRALRVGAGLDVRAPPAVLRRHAARAGHGRRRRRRALPRLARRLGHDRPHLARGLDQARLAGRRTTSSSTASSARTSTRTARAAATTR